MDFATLPRQLWIGSRTTLYAMEGRIFVSHASEDKDSVVQAIVDELQRRGYQLEYDEYTFVAGQSLVETIDRAIGTATAGLVILSRSFFQKPWPIAEKNALISRMVNDRLPIIPVWHGVSHGEVAAFSPILADRIALVTPGKQIDREGIALLCDQLEPVLPFSTPREIGRTKAPSVRTNPRRLLPPGRRSGGNRRLTVILMVLMAAGLVVTLWGVLRFRQSSSQTATSTSVEIIVAPGNLVGPTGGTASCSTASNITDRSDALRCTSDSATFDPCFTTYTRELAWCPDPYGDDTGVGGYRSQPKSSMGLESGSTVVTAANS